MWICSQIHAREHYAIPRALHAAGHLGLLLTDVYCPPRHPLRLVSGEFASRYHKDLADAPVMSWSHAALIHEWKRRKTSNRYIGFSDYGEWFAKRVRQCIARRTALIDGCGYFFSYDTGFLETAEFLRKRGLHCIVGQIDPGRVEQQLVVEENSRWPGWSTTSTLVPDEYNARREQEWNTADRVIVNSNWSRQALEQQGVPAEKIAVIPLCFEAGNVPARTRPPPGAFNAARPLRVLFLGQVILRKGIQYLVEAAHLLRNEPVEFSVVGPVRIAGDAVDSAPSNVVFHGRCARTQTAEHYQTADLFILPTLSDGFALTQLEAMAYGLPVVATTNCGEVVEHSRDGYLVPPRSAEAIAQTVERILAAPGWLRSASVAAQEKSRQFGLTRLTANLVALEQQLA